MGVLNSYSLSNGPIGHFINIYIIKNCLMPKLTEGLMQETLNAHCKVVKHKALGAWY